MKMTLMMGAVLACVLCGWCGRRDHLSWQGRDVVFLGDSITDARHIGCKTNYWGFLSLRMGFTAHVYGINGCQMSGIGGQLRKVQQERGDAVDAIFVFMGTNDFNGGVPLGDWFVESEECVSKDGVVMPLKKREFSYDMKTFRGRTNAALRDIKRTYPLAQVILLTPIHRGFAQFGVKNIQPDERYANQLGLFIHDYVEDVKTAGGLWSVPVIDLFGEAGLLPSEREFDRYVADPVRDRLHPSTEGHNRMSRVIEARLRAMPATFR